MGVLVAVMVDVKVGVCVMFGFASGVEVLSRIGVFVFISTLGMSVGVANGT
jgi:hypothetical protein